MTDKTDRVRAASLVVLSLAASSALAVIPQQEYDKYTDKHRTIQPMDTSYFGEQINLRDGISKNPMTRYTKAFMRDKDIEILQSGTRREMLNLERFIVERDRGPLNFERWAGSKSWDVP